MKVNYLKRKLNAKYGYHRDKVPQGTLNAFLKIESNNQPTKNEQTEDDTASALLTSACNDVFK